MAVLLRAYIFGDLENKSVINLIPWSKKSSNSVLKLGDFFSDWNVLSFLFSLSSKLLPLLKWTAQVSIFCGALS